MATVFSDKQWALFTLLGRDRLLRWMLCVGLLAGIATSPKLWQASREFPMIPALGWFPRLSQSVTVLLLVVLVLSVLGIAIFPRVGGAFLALFSSLTLLILFDVNRLQPWVYEYALMLLALAVSRPDVGPKLCAVILVALYFWSGVQKANLLFGLEVFPQVIQPLGDSLKPTWFLVPIIEVAIAIGLFIPRTRVIAVWGAVMMHVVLLGLLGPFGKNFNSVIWPWNLTMIGLVLCCFLREKEPILRASWCKWPAKGIVVLAGVMPAFNFLGYWPDALAASLYSGRARAVWVYVSDNATAAITKKYALAEGVLVPEDSGRSRLDVLAWSMSSLNVPFYASRFSVNALAEHLTELGVPRTERLILWSDPVSPGTTVRTYTEVEGSRLEQSKTEM